MVLAILAAAAPGFFDGAGSGSKPLDSNPQVVRVEGRPGWYLQSGQWLADARTLGSMLEYVFTPEISQERSVSSASRYGRVENAQVISPATNASSPSEIL